MISDSAVIPCSYSAIEHPGREGSILRQARCV
jgi:hypothetical protein